VLAQRANKKGFIKRMELWNSHSVPNNTMIIEICEGLSNPATPIALIVALVISEILPFFKQVEPNGILQGLVAMCQRLFKLTKSPL
jgi:hypothetical protein